MINVQRASKRAKKKHITTTKYRNIHRIYMYGQVNEGTTIQNK